MTYCIVERRLALRFKRVLRRYSEDTQTELVAERRGSDRRAGRDRRVRALAVPEDIDRRRVRNRTGRRVAEQRAALLPVEAPAPLPRRLRPHATAMNFVERITLTPEHEEDVEAARIVARIQSGRSGDFAELYERFFDRVYRYLASLLEDDRAAEWLTQETFLELHDGMASYELFPTGFRELVGTIVRTRAAEHLQRTRGIDLDDLSCETAASQVSVGLSEFALPDWVTDSDLQLLITRLPHAQRQAVMLRYLFGLTEPEIARACGCVSDAVFELNDGALSYLRERLAVLGREAAVPGMRLSMLRGRRPGRVIQRRRLALLSG